jgi:hypothetical protein
VLLTQEEEAVAFYLLAHLLEVVELVEVVQAVKVLLVLPAHLTLEVAVGEEVVVEVVPATAVQVVLAL